MTLVDGRKTVDAGSLSSCLLGRCHPELVRRCRRPPDAYASDWAQLLPREQAARDLLEVAFEGEEWADQVVFTVSSSEAADLGLLLAQTLTGREPLVRRERLPRRRRARPRGQHPPAVGCEAGLADGATQARPPLANPPPARARLRPRRDPAGPPLSEACLRTRLTRSPAPRPRSWTTARAG